MARPDLTKFIIDLEKRWKKLGLSIEWIMGVQEGTSLAYTMLGTSPEMISPTKAEDCLRDAGKEAGLTLLFEKQGAWTLSNKKEELVLWDVTLTVELARANITIVDRHVDPKTKSKKLHSRQRTERRWA